MALVIQEVHEDSVLSGSNVQPGDLLTHINSWAVRTQSNMRTAYKSSDLHLKFQRNGETYEIKVVAEDLGITVTDEDGLTFELSILESARKGDAPKIERARAVSQTFQKAPETVISSVVIKGIAWALFIVTLLSSMILLANYAVIEVPGRFETVRHVNGQLIGLVVVSLMSSGFFLALSYLLSHMQEQMMLVRSDLVRITDKLNY